MSEAGFGFAPPYALPHWPFVRPPELDAGDAGVVGRHPIVIVGGGLAGLTLACDLAVRGVRAVLLDEDDTVGVRGASSRGICYAQKSLEIFERLGLYERIVERGITWSHGKTFCGDDLVYAFDLQASNVSRQPPFVNLQQFYVEWFLVERLLELGLTDLRWKNRVTRIDPREDGVTLDVDTPAGAYRIRAAQLVDASGANSAIREQLGLDTHASRSADRWCISDVRFAKPLPAERWTWVEAPFNEGRSVWQHLMGDGVWRMDYQMAPDCDPEAVSRPEVAAERLRAQLGPEVAFEFAWIGPYQYRDHLLDAFSVGRVHFVGDAAHVVSPFGARGGNSGIQDAANLGWKLAFVTQGLAPPTLLDSYGIERRHAALQNLQVTRRTARFLAPRSAAERTMREAVLQLARRHAFARTLVNTGRMSVANDYPPAPGLAEGARSVPNLPLAWRDGRGSSLMQLLGEGGGFLGLWFAPDAAAADVAFDDEAVSAAGGAATGPAAGPAAGARLRLVAVGGDTRLPTLRDEEGQLARHFGAAPGTCVLVRPDAYLAGALPRATRRGIKAAVKRALVGADRAAA